MGMKLCHGPKPYANKILFRCTCTCTKSLEILGKPTNASGRNTRKLEKIAIAGEGKHFRSNILVETKS